MRNSEILEEFREKKRNKRDGMDSKVTATVAAEHTSSADFRGILSAESSSAQNSGVHMQHCVPSRVTN